MLRLPKIHFITLIVVFVAASIQLRGIVRLVIQIDRAHSLPPGSVELVYASPIEVLYVNLFVILLRACFVVFVAITTECILRRFDKKPV